MRKALGATAVLLALTGGAFVYSASGSGGNDWCNDSSWLRSASSTYYYLYRDNPHSEAEITKSATYGGQLMTAYKASMAEGRLPEGIEDRLTAWSLSLREEVENGGTVASRTDSVLHACAD
ncbi:hypothetical protein [Streptomyces sp. NPDC017448]|uniref:hypothetical protein n=1 Tax=Streptomyces sp. NPDC017448 TaxID=3364996 RepID=UPI0037A42324